MSMLPGASMSLLKTLQNIKERLEKPSKKRQKLGEDEDDWCDALNHLSVDSDSDDDEKYFDAPEFVNEPDQQVTSGSPPKGKKRKKRQKQFKNKSPKKSDMNPFQHTSFSSRGRRTNEGVLQQRQLQSSPRHSSSGGFQFDTKDPSPSSLMETESFHVVAAGGSNTATSSSSEAGVQVGFKRLTSIHDPPQEHPIKGYTGAISDSKLEKLAKALMGEEDRARSLGRELGFSYTDVFGYCGYGKPKDSSGILRMLRAWKHKTPEAKQISVLLEALEKANLKHLADDLHLQEAPSTSTTKKTEPFRFGCGRSNNASLSSLEADVQVGPKQSATIHDPPQSQLPMKDYTDKGGLTDAKLKKVADAIGDNIDKIRLLGEKLGFSRYWIKNNSRGMSGTLRMLHDWKLRTTKSEQMPKLLAALKSSQLQNVADLLHQEQGKLEKRKVTVTLMTSWHLSSIEGLQKKLITLQRRRPDLIEAVKVIQIPFSGLHDYTFTADVDIMVLCHSIVNRRLSITNVTDSLYDEFLDHCNKKLGKERIVVIAHDFRQEKDEVRAVTMNTFKHTQWSTFEKAGLVMICGMMDKTPEIQEKDWKSLVKFLEDASKSTPTIADISQTTHLKKGTSDTKRKPFESEKEKKDSNISSKPLWTSSGRAGGMKTRFRKPVIYICTSWGLDSIRGLKEKLKTLLEKSFSRYEIREQELPYSRLEDYKFPSEVDSSDAMILCHSVQNRGFSITDVQNSIYDEFLKLCNRVFGRGHMAVIIHDFEDKPEILKVHLETIRRTQPTTYELADLVALAGLLDDPDVKLCHDKSTSLETFVKRLF